MYLQQTINCGGKLIDLSEPICMGILNVTPDSFYDGGVYNRGIELIIKRAGEMLEEGASIIDIGGMSSRPGARLIDIEEELQRVIPTIKALLSAFPDIVLSVDTLRTEVARQAVDSGATLINDISAGQIDKEMFEYIGRSGVPYVLMHMQGLPATMQQNPTYGDIIVEITDFFINKISLLRQLGVKDIILDPGFGFGKTLNQNYTLLKNISAFHILECPVLVGVSRKSMVNKVLDISPEMALNGTTALHMVALINGASILRVHDVKEAMETIKLWKKIQEVG